MDSLSKLTVLISGSGTNLGSLIRKSKDGALPAQIIRVISNRKGVYGLQRAEDAGIPTRYHNLVKYKKENAATDEGVQRARDAYDSDLAKLILEDQPDLVVCAGFMHVFGDSFLALMNTAQVPVINLHPALPGEYNGTSAIERAHQDWLDGRISRTGVMVHYVIREVDMGRPILVREIPFVTGFDEDIDSFKEKLHSIEWEVLPEATAIALKALNEKQGLVVASSSNVDSEKP